MKSYIVIDGGTTNTRIYLVRDKKSIGSLKLHIGGKVGVDNNGLLKNEIKRGIEKLLADFKLEAKDIECILASGMITSASGLYELEHITTPAGIEKIAENVARVTISEVSDIPFVFIRGIKTPKTELRECDMMRGEETELMGIIDESLDDAVYILPGSHSKIIKVTRDGVITDFCTLLTGEMIAALSENTILKETVDLSISDIDEDALLDGYNYAEREGLNNALFKVRVQKNLFGASPIACYSFFMGAVLSGEIKAILKYKENTVVIGGKAQLRRALKIILEAVSDKKIITLSDDEVESSVVKGIMKIYEKTR